MHPKTTRRVKHKALRFLLTIVFIAFCASLLWLGLSAYLNVTGDPVTMSASISDDGFWKLSWTPFDSSGNYTVTLCDRGNVTVFQKDHHSGEEIVVDKDIPAGIYTISISRKNGNILSKMQYYREHVALSVPTASGAEVTFSPKTKSLSATWISTAESFTLFDLTSGEAVPLSDINTTSAEIFFGEGKNLNIPAAEETVIIGISATKDNGSCKVLGEVRELTKVTRDDLYGSELDLTYTIGPKNAVIFSWIESKGSYYELSMEEAEKSITLFKAPMELTTYTTDSLKSNIKYKFVLRAYDEEKNVLCEDSVEFKTEVSPINATIWPNMSLPVYSDTDQSTQIGTVLATEMYCVLDEDTKKNLFMISYGENIGWIDSNYCMINLPEYIGDLCSYDITNAYSSMFTYHEYEITGLTGTVVAGYETVQLADGSFLVPLLYPTAQKLLHASNLALEFGCRLRIYDAFRPNMATNRIYGIAADALYKPIPYMTYTGNSVELPTMADNSREQLAMLDFVQNSGWQLSSFIALGNSYHNMGIAVDVCLEDAESGELLNTQTMMHDLSTFSTTYHNKEGSTVLFKLMEAAGFQTIISDWWHFKDAEAERLNLEWCYGGVSIKGWTYDGIGWRYRDEQGNYVTGSVTDGGTYALDSNGYLIDDNGTGQCVPLTRC